MPEPILPDPIPPADQAVALPPSLRLLKWLVIVLTLTMIGGVITVVGLIVTRMPQAFTAAVTFGTGWIAIVTTDDRILIFGKDGALKQEVNLTTP
jgi:Flp pilus assembly protein protease CpaA